MQFSLGLINCPRCNHPHKFGHKNRKIDNDKYDVYVSCPKCYWEKILFTGTNIQIRDYYQSMKLKHRSRVDSSLEKVYLKKLRRLND